MVGVEIMKYFKDKNNQVYAFEADGSQDELIPVNLIALTEYEADQLRIPNLSVEQLSENVRDALQLAIDDKARSFGFSGGNALMLYAGFLNPFQPLAQVFATWEASVWVEADAYKADVIAGIKPMLSGGEAVALMPIYPV